MVKNPLGNAGDTGRRCGFDLQVGKIPWRMKWQPTPIFFPGKFHDQRSMVAIFYGVAKSQTQFSD